MRRITEFIKYLWYCRGRHGIHSPFVYDLLDNGIYVKDFPVNRKIEKLRKRLARGNKIIVNDYGTAGGIFKGKGKLRTIANRVSISRKHGILLAKLVAYFQPDRVVELGTSIGISSAYMAGFCKLIVTVEGNKRLLEIAKENHHELEIYTASYFNKTFEQFIKKDLWRLPSVPFLYVDGDHSYEATVKYFKKILKYATEDSVFVFDDIYWSKGMTKAWNEIKNHPKVTLSLDFYRLGVIFFKPVKEKQHFRIWY